MSNEFNQNAVSSMSSVINSIDNDRQVYRWFLILISLPQIQQRLSKQNKTKEEYQALKRIQATEIITYLLMALIILASFLIKQPWGLVLGVLPLIVLVRLFHKNRKCVMFISEQFLLEHIPTDTLNQQTLYQTCEYFAKEYHILSLVDLITYQDFIGRKALLAAILFIPFIYPFKSWQILLGILVAYLVTLVIVNSSFVLRRLK